MREKGKPPLRAETIAEIQERYARAPKDRRGCVKQGFAKALSIEFDVTPSRISQIGRGIIT